MYAAGQIALIGLLYIGYSTGRHFADGRENVALNHAHNVWRLQEALRLPSEVALQQAALHWVGLVKLANVYYIGVHFPAVLILITWVFLHRRGEWRRVRNVLILTTGAGLMIEILYPLAPPRFLAPSAGLDLVDTGTVFGPSPYKYTDGVANQYAAMPSLHVGWAIIEAWAVITITKSRFRRLAVLHPIVTVGVVVVTANHYWLDGVVGGALVGAAVLITGRFQLLGAHPRALDPASAAAALAPLAVPTAPPAVPTAPAVPVVPVVPDGLLPLGRRASERESLQDGSTHVIDEIRVVDQKAREPAAAGGRQPAGGRHVARRRV